MSRARLITALVLGAILAIPGVNMLGAMLMLPLPFYILLGLIANFAPVLIVAVRTLALAGLPIGHRALVHHWQFFGIIWIGCAFGMSRWGDAGASIGGKNAPFLEMLVMPWLALYSHLTG